MRQPQCSSLVDEGAPQCRPLASSSETKPCYMWRTCKECTYSITLPSLQQNYLFAMATSFDKLENNHHYSPHYGSSDLTKSNKKKKQKRYSKHNKQLQHYTRYHYTLLTTQLFHRSNLVTHFSYTNSLHNELLACVG